MDTESLQIHLNSKYASKYNNSNSDCTFNLPNIEVPIGHHIMLSIQSATIPYSFYNIDSNNNKIYLEFQYLDEDIGEEVWSDNITIYEITHGNYNAYQLASYLTNILPLKVTYDSIKNKFKYTSIGEDNVFDFRFHLETTASSSLGMCEDLQYNTSFSRVLISPYVINLASKQCIYITSNYHTGSIDNVISKNYSILCCVPIVGQPYSLISYKNTGNFRTNLFSNLMSYITIRLVDEKNNLIQLNGQHFNITLQIDVMNFVD